MGGHSQQHSTWRTTLAVHTTSQPFGFLRCVTGPVTRFLKTVCSLSRWSAFTNIHRTGHVGAETRSRCARLQERIEARLGVGHDRPSSGVETSAATPGVLEASEKKK